jgi:hypothetical protein
MISRFFKVVPSRSCESWVLIIWIANCWGRAEGLRETAQSGHTHMRSRALLGCPRHEYRLYKALATNERGLEGASSVTLPTTFDRYEFPFCRWSGHHPGWETKAWESRRRLRSEGAIVTAAWRSVRSWLHVVVAHWRAQKVVAKCNSRICPLDYVLIQSCTWLMVFKTL